VLLQFFRDKVLAAGRPEGQEGGLGKDVTLRQAIDAAESQIAEAFKGQPLAEAAIRKTLGETYNYLGEPALAVPQLERALALLRHGLGLEHSDTTRTMGLPARAYLAAGKFDQAVSLSEEALKLNKARLGLEHPDTLMSMANLGVAYHREARTRDQALPLLEESVMGESIRCFTPLTPALSPLRGEGDIPTRFVPRPQRR